LGFQVHHRVPNLRQRMTEDRSITATEVAVKI